MAYLHGATSQQHRGHNTAQLVPNSTERAEALLKSVTACARHEDFMNQAQHML